MTVNHRTSSIVLTDQDSVRLSALSAGQTGWFSEGSRVLAREIEGAVIVEAAQIPPNVVTMNSRVTVRDNETGQTRTFTLVYPGDEDSSVGNLSILTPVGAALIGLTEGDTLTWITRNGQTKAMNVIEIQYQPEANGRFDQ